MTEERLRLLVRSAIKSLSAWEAFSSIVPLDYLPPLLRIIAEAVDGVVHYHKKVPSEGAIIGLIKERMDVTSEIIEDEYEEILDILRAEITPLTTAEIGDWAYEFTALNYRTSLIEELSDVGAGDIGPYLAQAHENIEALRPSIFQSDDELVAAWDNIHKREQVPVSATGVDFLDYSFKGLVNSRTYTCMGPTGSLKSTSAIQLAVAFAGRHLTAWRKNAEKGLLGKVFFVTTEDGQEEIMIRMLSHAALVDREVVSRESPVPLTTKDTISEEDRNLRTKFGAVFSETDRISMATKRLKRNLRLIDMKDETTVPKNMCPIEWIRQQINRSLDSDVTADGRKRSFCALVIIDHCEVLISRLSQRAGKGSNRWEITDLLPETIRHKLADYFKCPVWAVHQLSGKANEKLQKQRIEHTDAKGSRSWGTYFDVSVTASKIDRTTNTSFLWVTKNRYGPIRDGAHLKLVGNLCTIEMIGTVSEEDLKAKPKARGLDDVKAKPEDRRKATKVKRPDKSLPEEE